ncbi:MAG: hypothetical protein SGARI_000807 [Bacillariaceae sp.]
MYKIVLEMESTENEKPGFAKAWFPVTSSQISERIKNDGTIDNSKNIFDEKLFSSGMCPEELSTLNNTITTAGTVSSTLTMSNREESDAKSTEPQTNKLKPFLKHGRNPS